MEYSITIILGVTTPCTFQTLSSSVNEMKLNFDNLKTQIELLRQSAGTLSDLQTKLAASHTADSEKMSENMAELGRSYQSLVEQNKELVKKLGELGGEQTELAALVQTLSGWVSWLI